MSCDMIIRLPVVSCCEMKLLYDALKFLAYTHAKLFTNISRHSSLNVFMAKFCPLVVEMRLP